VVTAKDTSGKEYETTREQRKGSAQFPLSDAELESKFRRTAGVVIPEKTADRIVELAGSIETAETTEELSSLLLGQAQIPLARL